MASYLRRLEAPAIAVNPPQTCLVRWGGVGNSSISVWGTIVISTFNKRYRLLLTFLRPCGPGTDAVDERGGG